MATCLWLYLAIAIATLVLLRACAATRGHQDGPPSRQVWVTQLRWAVVWPVYWVKFWDAWMKSRSAS